MGGIACLTKYKTVQKHCVIMSKSKMYKCSTVL